VKATLLLSCTVVIVVLVLAHFGFHLGNFFDAASRVTYHQQGKLVTTDFLRPGLRYKPPYGALDFISLGFALLFGCAGLPHILMRFYTVPDAKTARLSVVWAMVLIGSFFIMTSVVGLGSAVIVGPDYIVNHGGTNMGGPLLARNLGGDALLGVVSAVAFATILAVVAGLTISASTSFAHDFWINVIRRGVERRSNETVLVARIAALVVGAISIILAIAFGPNSNSGVLATLAMAVAASAHFPVVVLSIYWRRFNTAGALAGLSAGLFSSIGLILISPTFMGIDSANAVGATRHLFQMNPWFPLENPGILSVPLGFIGAILGTLLSPKTTSESKFNELTVRANTGLGAEVSIAID
jgi:cation/acetate symporter